MPRKHKYPTDESFFENWNSPMAYILGFISADGSIHRSTLGIELQYRDSEILYYIKNMISPTRPISQTTKKNKKYLRIRINSKAIVQNLIKYGITSNKSKTIEPPCIPPKYLGAYIRGVFDGDGWIHLRRNSIETGICSGSKIYLEKLRKLLPIGKLRSRIRMTKKGKKSIVYQWDMNRKDSLLLRDLMYEDNGFSLKRKKDLFFSKFYVKSNRFWTEEQINYLKNNFKPKTKGLLNTLSTYIGKSKSSVSKKIWELQLVNF